MLEGAVRLLAVLDAHEPFPLTAEQRERVNNLLSESDAARTFIMTGVGAVAVPAGLRDGDGAVCRLPGVLR